MQPATYYNLPQAPGKYQDAVVKGGNIYDDVASDRSADGFVCGLPVLPFAYLVSFYVLVEGIVVLVEGPSHFESVAGLHSFSKAEAGFLDVVAWGDIVAAVAGILGIWLSHNLMPIGWRQSSKMHSSLAILGAGILLAWRSLVCISFAPWAGILLAFTSPSMDKVWMWTCLCAYIALSIFIVYALAMAFRQVVSDSRRFQQHLDAQAVHERQQLLMAAHNYRQENQLINGDAMHEHEIEPELFGVLPLAETVTLYTIVIAIACLWNFLHLVITGHTSGGWAFFSQTPQVSSTFWLEAFLWPISFFCALIGIAGASSFSGSGFLEEKPSASSLLMFLLASMGRFALLFAVTGMTIIELDTCGFYVNGLSKLAFGSTGMTSLLLHCDGMQYLFLAGVLLCCFLDGYLIWGTFQLWHHAQDWEFVKPGELSKGAGDYGSAPGVFQEDDQWFQEAS